VKSTGDGFILEFGSVHPALNCVADLHRRCNLENAAMPAAPVFMFRAGVHVTDVFVGDGDIYGRGVNLAARLASVAQPGDTIVSETVRDVHVPGIDPEIEDIGPVFFKNAVASVPAYRIVDGRESLRAELRALPVVPSLIPTIAVIPFRGIFVEETDSAVGELLADLLIARLSVGDSMRVISRLSTSKLRMRTIEHGEVRHLLGSDYALSGSYRMTDRHVSLIAELADTRSGEALWVKEFRGSIDDLVSRDSEMVRRIVGQITPQITHQETKRVKFLPLPSLDGFSLQLAAIAMMHRTSRDEFNRSREALEHLVERYPTAPEPRSWLAKWYVLRFTRGYVTVENAEAELALYQTRRALDGNPEFALALAMESFVRMHLLRELDVAERCVEDALCANPNEPLAWLFLSVCQQFRGNGRPAVQAAETAISLSPIDPLRHYFDSLASSAALAAEDYERAIDLATRSLRLNRLHPPTLRTLAISQVETGRIAAARATVQRLLELDPELTIAGYMARAPKGAGVNRSRYAHALQQAGVPMG
jgi:TolB-like protein/cytochrome c-type biogenesis protein CcmH/NrfG